MPKQDIKGLGHPSFPVVGPLTALHKMARHPVVSAMRAQDRVVTTSRRIVASGGLHGSLSWRVPNSDPNQESGPQTHPGPTSSGRVHDLHVDLTPGCFLQLSAIVLPCGQTQVSDGNGGFVAGGSVGNIRLEITWHDRDGESVETEHVVPLPPSTLPTGSEPQGAGAFFSGLRRVEINDIRPPIPNIVQQQRWCRHVTARVKVIYEGAPRIVDWQLHEVPVVYALKNDDDADLWCSHFYGVPTPSGAGQQFNHPLDRRGLGDPRYGTENLMRVQLAQRLRLGPHLAHWSAHSEGSGLFDAPESAIEVSDTGGFRSLFSASHTAYDPDRPGWSVSCGGYARRWDDNGDLILRNRIANVPVWVWCFAGLSAGTGTFRFSTGPRSHVDIPLGDPGGFRFAYGHLRVGLTPEQPVIGQAFVEHSGSGEALIGAFGVCRADQWAPAYVGV